MKTTRIVSFTWDNSMGEDHNGRHLIIGQHLPKSEDGYNENCIVVYGIGINIPDPRKDFELSSFSCHNSNLEEDSLSVVTKEAAREMILKEIDYALDILFNPANIGEVEEMLNKSSEDEDTDEDTDEDED